MARVDWVRNFYAKQYEWADWRRRWSDFDPDDRDPRVDAVTRHAGSEPLRILELGSGTGTTAAALAVAGHDVVAIEIQGELAAYTNELAAVVSGGSLRAIEGDFYKTNPRGSSTSSRTSMGSGSEPTRTRGGCCVGSSGGWSRVGVPSWTCWSRGIGPVVPGTRKSSRRGVGCATSTASTRGDAA